ncbi:MAG: hypothetical protein ACI8RN_000571 [Glaciecola sp.]|jgi:hypothetical protein|uniref:hypothetical protein n=1 Tax=Congregibacter sp. TaxID=2744308 RepID=UPI0039E4A796
MYKHINVNGLEKQRLRNSIEEEVRRFLENGGSITVLDGPDSERGRYRGSTWRGDSDAFQLMTETPC